ncbi:MAG: hypothetical protein R2726_23365 [Acidimicrobiales bacterium]
MAKSKKKKQAQARARAQHRQQKEKQRQAQHTHLPKAGTKEDDDYLLRRSREDVVDFGLAPVKRGAVNWVIVLVVIGLFVAGTIGLLVLTTR